MNHTTDICCSLDVSQLSRPSDNFQRRAKHSSEAVHNLLGCVDNFIDGPCDWTVGTRSENIVNQKCWLRLRLKL